MECGGTKQWLIEKIREKFHYMSSSNVRTKYYIRAGSCLLTIILRVSLGKGEGANFP